MKLNVENLAKKEIFLGEPVIKFNHFAIVYKYDDEALYTLRRFFRDGRDEIIEKKKFLFIEVHKHFIVGASFGTGKHFYVKDSKDEVITNFTHPNEHYPFIRSAFKSEDISIEKLKCSKNRYLDTKLLLVSWGYVKFLLNYKGEIYDLTYYRQRPDIDYESITLFYIDEDHYELRGNLGHEEKTDPMHKLLEVDSNLSIR